MRIRAGIRLEGFRVLSRRPAGFFSKIRPERELGLTILTLSSRHEQVLHRRPGKQHLNGHKTTERKTRLSGERQIGAEQIPLVKGLLPYSRKRIR